MMLKPVLLKSFKTGKIIEDFGVIVEYLKLSESERKERGILMLCTYVEDINGTTIYSGHKVKISDAFDDGIFFFGVVEYLQSGCCFVIKSDRKDIYYLDHILANKYVEVKDGDFNIYKKILENG